MQEGANRYAGTNCGALTEAIQRPLGEYSRGEPCPLTI
jgi:hypothetical protein